MNCARSPHFSLDLTLLSLVPEFRNLTFESPQIRLIVNRSSSVLDIRSFDASFLVYVVNFSGFEKSV